MCLKLATAKSGMIGINRKKVPIVTVMSVRPRIRWIAPLAAAVVLVGGGVTARALASSPPAAGTPSATSLVADLASMNIDGLSGTVSVHADLGIPTFGQGGAEFQSLISGTHTIKVALAEPDQARLTLEGTNAKSEVIRNGSDLWLWSSAKNTAAHATLPSKPAGRTPQPLPSGLPSAMPTTPQEAAQALMSLLGPSTSVTVGDTVTVAGRSADQLIVAPKAAASLVQDITIAIDTATHVPLRVQVFAKNYAPPAIEIGFTQVSFTKPASSAFAFTPPAGAKVNELKIPAHHGASPSPGTKTPSPGTKTKPQFATTGSGWTTVAAVRLPGNILQPDSSSPAPSTGPNPLGQLKGLLNLIPTVTGPFGSGKLVQTRLVSVLILDDGRIVAGAVTPAALETAAASPALALPR
jgi:outer membrane lipoprotein-sorting protein